MNPQEDLNLINPDADQAEKDPKTGKTISRKRAFILAGGAMLAGTAMRNIPQDEGIAEILLDSDGDGTADTILTDANADGTYEVSSEIQDDPVSAESSGQQAFNPNTAPMASPGTVTNDMSFTEAFAAAREELGPGGVFAWQGQYYNTFYAEEVNDDNQPVVDYETTDAHALPSMHETITHGDTQPDEPDASLPTEDSGFTPNIMAADFDIDGNIDAVFVDLNQDGSADIMYTDLNQDGQITEDEFIMIHDPDTLEISATPADPSLMSVDVDADGMDDILLGDVNSDQVADVLGVDENQDMTIDESEISILNPELMEGMQAPELQYSGEVSSDMPDDVSDEVLDQMNDDLSGLEDNFDEINEWS